MIPTSVTDKPKPKGAWLRDVAAWFWEFFGPTIKAAIGPAVLSGSFLLVTGWDFVKTPHQVHGSLIVAGVGVFGLCIVSVGFNLLRWRRRHHARTLSVEYEGYSFSLHWSMGTAGDKSVMFVAGDFIIAALVPRDDVAVPRSVLHLRYRLWG